MSNKDAGVDLPCLRVVDMQRIVLHEDADERRVSALSQRLQADGSVRNPPIVAPLDEERYVVLDGANRVSALRQLGVPDVMVQIVEYDEVDLSTWYHLVTGVHDAGLMGALSAIENLELKAESLESARVSMRDASCLAYLVLPDQRVFELHGGSSVHSKSQLLRQVVSVYKGRATIHRVQSDEIEALREFYTDIAGLFVFPTYRPEHILEMARLDAKLPSGITRHLIPMRALRTNTDIGFLWSDMQRSEKNRWLSEWTRKKMQSREIRIYEERTVLYDE